MEGRVDAVLDTNVLVAALHSARGASHRILSRVGASERFRVHLSVPLVLEYEDVLKRRVVDHGLSDADIDAILDYLCAVGERHRVRYLWRPFLSDPKDDMVLEVAVAAGCEAIVTFNVRDFARVPDAFGVRVLTPGAFLWEIEEPIP